MHDWVKQQQLLQRAGAWEARASSAEAANRGLEARLSTANEDRRATESRLADVTKQRDRLVARVKILDRNLGTARKAAGAPGEPPAQTGEGADGAEGPVGERGAGGGGGAMPPVSGTFLTACGRGMPRRRHAPARCGPCPRASWTGWPCWPVASGRRSRWTLWRPTGPGWVPPTRTCAGSTPPPHRLTSAAIQPSFAEAVVEQSSQGSANWSSAPRGGGGVAHPLTLGPPLPSNLHGCYLYIFMYEYMYKYTPPPGMGSLTDIWGTPPTLCEIFFGTVCISIGVSCAH